MLCTCSLKFMIDYQVSFHQFVSSVLPYFVFSHIKSRKALQRFQIIAPGSRVATHAMLQCIIKIIYLHIHWYSPWETTMSFLKIGKFGKLRVKLHCSTDWSETTFKRETPKSEFYCKSFSLHILVLNADLTQQRRNSVAISRRITLKRVAQFIARFLWPGFDSLTRGHMWVESVVGSRLAPRIFSGFFGFPPSTKINTSKFQFDREFFTLTFSWNWKLKTLAFGNFFKLWFS